MIAFTLFTVAALASSQTPVGSLSPSSSPQPKQSGPVAPLAAPGSSAFLGNTRGVNSWSPLGPNAHDVKAIAVHPTDSSVVLVGGVATILGDSGMYRSTDSGANWAATDVFLDREVFDIEFQNGNTVFAGTDRGIWRSDDAGLTWVDLNLGIGNNEVVLDVEVDPSNSAILFAGVSRSSGNQTQTFLKSSDSGMTWTWVPILWGVNPSFTSISIDPSNPDNIAAAYDRGYQAGGVVVSNDGGVSWANWSSGLPYNPMNRVQISGSRVLVGGGKVYGAQDAGLFESVDNGINWTDLSDGSWPVMVINDFAIDPTNPARILCASAGGGIYETVDSGASWTTGVGGMGSLSCNVLAFSPSDPSQLYVGVESNAVWKSTNAGGLFTHVGMDIGMLDVHAMAANPLNPSEVAIAYQYIAQYTAPNSSRRGGVQTSLDGGKTWAEEPVPASFYSAVHFGPMGTLYAISQSFGSVSEPEGVYARTGTTWSLIGPNRGNQITTRLHTVVTDPTDPTGNTLFAGGADYGWVERFEATIWKTTDRGGAWTKVFEGPVDDQFVSAIKFPDPGSGVLVASVSGSSSDYGGVLRSVDNGDNWTEVVSGLNPQVSGSDLSLHPNGSTLLLADSVSSNGGLFRSFDLGASWNHVPGFRWANAVTHDFQIGARVMTGHSNNSAAYPGVKGSVDSGMSHFPFNVGIPDGANVRDLLTVNGGGVFYVATSLGVYKYEDPVGASYCSGVPNSTGEPGIITATGSTMASDNILTLAGSQLPTAQLAYFLASRTQGFVANPGGSMGNLCVLGHLVRLNGTGQYGLTTTGGWFSLRAPLDNLPEPPVLGTTVVAGDTWSFQLWHRDMVGGSSTSNFTNAVEVQFH